jgi:GNAT superfamily N-acetyltransferase
MNTAVREARLSDVDTLCGLAMELQEQHIASRPEMFKPPQMDEIGTWFRQLLEKPSANVWVACVEGTVRGYLVAVISELAEGPFNFARTWMQIDQIAVHQEHRRQGIARALLENARGYARTKGVADIELASWSFNQVAHRAFASLGFVPKVVRFELGRGS